MPRCGRRQSALGEGGEGDGGIERAGGKLSARGGVGAVQ